MSVQLVFYLCFGQYFWGWGKAGEPKEDGSMTLAEAKNVMNEYNSDLVSWINFAIYCFLGYACVNLLFIVMISAVSGSSIGGAVKFYQLLG